MTDCCRTSVFRQTDTNARSICSPGYGASALITRPSPACGRATAALPPEPSGTSHGGDPDRTCGMADVAGRVMGGGGGGDAGTCLNRPGWASAPCGARPPEMARFERSHAPAHAEIKRDPSRGRSGRFPFTASHHIQAIAAAMAAHRGANPSALTIYRIAPATCISRAAGLTGLRIRGMCRSAVGSMI